VGVKIGLFATLDHYGTPFYPREIGTMSDDPAADGLVSHGAACSTARTRLAATGDMHACLREFLSVLKDYFRLLCHQFHEWVAFLNEEAELASNLSKRWRRPNRFPTQRQPTKS
jgi:hypothetical protein